MSLFCKHDFKIISETVTESRLELMVRVGMKVHVHPYETMKLVKRKSIQILKCEKCGRIKRYVDEI